jgi:hypothetical protein
MIDNKDGTVTLTDEEYEGLTQDAEFLSLLFAAGVDNWDGYYVALEAIRND